jgi:hypothetical protein
MAVKHLKREWAHAERIVAQVPDLGYYDDGKGHIEPAYFVRADVEYDASVHAFAADGEPRRYLVPEREVDFSRQLAIGVVALGGVCSCQLAAVGVGHQRNENDSYQRRS